MEYNQEKSEVHKMLFQKKKEVRCELCIHATILDEDKVQCKKKGTRYWDEKCLAFSYDLCKRKPLKAKAVDFVKYEEYDYSL